MLPPLEVGCCHPQKLDVATLGCCHPLICLAFFFLVATSDSDVATLGSRKSGAPEAFYSAPYLCPKVITSGGFHSINKKIKNKKMKPVLMP
jgi:hypothetical protein